jgi:deoxyribodipyrimidine photo-lyase
MDYTQGGSNRNYTLFLFHRDLRLQDNTALLYAQSLGLPILPVFIFTDKQVGPSAPIKSQNSIQFMLQSLKELASSILLKKGRLIFLYGDTVKELEDLVKKLGKPTTIVETKDYTPFAKNREDKIQRLCKKTDIQFTAIHDIYLLDPGTILNGSGKTFQKFTPFYEKARLKQIRHPSAASSFKFYKIDFGLPLQTIAKRILLETNKDIHVKGGRKEAAILLKRLPLHYNKTHDYPSVETSSLSAHHHFGTISIRETYWAMKTSSATAESKTAFIRQLFWRDFYGNIMNSFEDLYNEDPLKFQSGPWIKTKIFNDWKNGKTGIDIIDAGMNQLNKSGYMHNRMRLICASYLVKDMNVHWRLGERYFAEKLVDYDITQNMMNWIWVASELPFASAPFRRFAPEIQTETFNKDATYRNMWLI